MRWVDKYKSTNNITRKKRDYKAYKITNSHISFINQQLKQNKTITMDELLTLSEIIKSNEKYFIWNYETMLYLNEVYFDLLYDFVEGINKHYPKVKDGNINYMK